MPHKRAALHILCFLFGHTWEKFWMVLVDPNKSWRDTTGVFICKRCGAMVADRLLPPYPWPDPPPRTVMEEDMKAIIDDICKIGKDYQEAGLLTVVP